jgi:hypothetical protein
VAETVTVRVEGTGRNIERLVVHFGDGAADSIAAQGAQVAAFSSKHAYESAGAFRIDAAVVDFSGARATRALQMQVVGTSGPVH